MSRNVSEVGGGGIMNIWYISLAEDEWAAKIFSHGAMGYLYGSSAIAEDLGLLLRQSRPFQSFVLDEYLFKYFNRLLGLGDSVGLGDLFRLDCFLLHSEKYC